MFVAAAAAFLFVATAHAASIFDITFPIPELGNCADRLACKAYCDDPANRDACTSFAEAHGITVHASPKSSDSHDSQSNTQSHNQSDGQKVQAIQKDGGPGQCAVGASDPMKACHAYCNDASHIEECVAYGKSHNILNPDELQRAEKIAAALKSGAALPRGCTDAQSCEKICQNPTSVDQARSCFSFAKAANILPPGFDEEKAQKVFSALENGTVPFSSLQDFKKCDGATDPEIIKKCSDFAVQSGAMTQEQANVLQQTGGMGPGGCTGKDSCDSYCQSHQDECFRFAQDHGLIPPQQQEDIQRAAGQLKNALNGAPSGTQDCIAGAIGQDKLDALIAGTKPGTPEIGDAMRKCFDQFAPQGGDQGQFMPPPGDSSARGQYAPQNGPTPHQGSGPATGITPRPHFPNEGNGQYPQPQDRDAGNGAPGGANGQNYLNGESRGTPPQGMSGNQMPNVPYQGMEGPQSGPNQQYSGYMPYSANGNAGTNLPPPTQNEQQFSPSQGSQPGQFMPPLGSGSMPPPQGGNSVQYMTPPPGGTGGMPPSPPGNTAPPSAPPPPSSPPPGPVSFLGFMQAMLASALLPFLLR